MGVEDDCLQASSYYYNQLAAGGSVRVFTNKDVFQAIILEERGEQRQ